jgi:hypothetical protein
VKGTLEPGQHCSESRPPRAWTLLPNGCWTSTERESRPPKPKRKNTSEVLPLIDEDDPRSPHFLDCGKVAERRAIIERQNAICEIGDEGTVDRH